jgi:hypothetical protein
MCGDIFKICLRISECGIFYFHIEKISIWCIEDQWNQGVRYAALISVFTRFIVQFVCSKGGACRLLKSEKPPGTVIKRMT